MKINLTTQNTAKALRAHRTTDLMDVGDGDTVRGPLAVAALLASSLLPLSALARAPPIHGARILLATAGPNLIESDDPLQRSSRSFPNGTTSGTVNSGIGCGINV
jgi:hypothetical protein